MPLRQSARRLLLLHLTAEEQQPEDESTDLNDPDTDLEPEDDTEIDRQEESDADVEMSEVDMMHQAFI